MGVLTRWKQAKSLKVVDSSEILLVKVEINRVCHMKVMVSEGAVGGQLAAGISAATRINENFYVYISTLKSKSVI